MTLAPRDYADKIFAAAGNIIDIRAKTAKKIKPPSESKAVFFILTASGTYEFINISCCDYFIFPGKHMRLTVIYYHPTMIFVNAVIIVAKLS